MRAFRVGNELPQVKVKFDMDIITIKNIVNLKKIKPFFGCFDQLMKGFVIFRSPFFQGLSGFDSSVLTTYLEISGPDGSCLKDIVLIG